MNFKKIISLFAFLILLFTTTNISYAKKYNCGWISSDGGIHFSQYSPNETSRCNYYKGSEYTRCIKERNELVSAYRNGKCSEIIEKHYNIDGCDCTVEYTNNKAYGYSCSGNGSTICNTSTAMEKLKNQYK